MGVGAYLLIPNKIINQNLMTIHEDNFSSLLKFKQFQNTSSTQLEIETLLWALHDIRNQSVDKGGDPLKIYTDSQAIVDLLRRREALEEKKFYSKRGKKELTHALLYRKYYSYYDVMKFDVLKVKGHAPSRKHTPVERIFSYVDQAVRNRLKASINY